MSIIRFNLVEDWPNLPKIGRGFVAFTRSLTSQYLVIDLKVRQDRPQGSNFAFKVRSSKNLRGSCRSRGGRCRGTNGNSSYIFSAEKCAVIIKYSKVWKWCRTFSANFFDLNVRHQACLRSFCVEHSGQLPVPMQPPSAVRASAPPTCPDRHDAACHGACDRLASTSLRACCLPALCEQ
jgi:hypothetical protein